MTSLLRQTKELGWRGLSWMDGLFNRLYRWRYNPLYHSGAIAVVTLVVLLVTGLYLLLFYRIGEPYSSVAAITDQVWAGRWIRTLHRYASDLAIVAIVVHAVRVFLQGRSWGARALAWISGVALLATFLVCGWTGYVMVWDVQAQYLAVEGARLLDALPILSEPIGRTFVGERSLPGAFFFLNLFLHIVIPVGLAALLWMHVSRVARPALLPPKGLGRVVVGVLVGLSVLAPVGMAAPADLFRLPESVPLDLFYSFFLPLSAAVDPAWTWVVGGALTAVAVLAPWWSRPGEARTPPPSEVDERLCTGCEQCALDCPYEAIRMVGRDDGRAGLVATVDPALCVSCGICAGSCAPMGVGPAGRTGRDQLAGVKAFIDRHEPGSRDVVLVACDRGSGGVGAFSTFRGAPVFPVSCAGSLHTSVVEYLVRSGAGGVLVVSCPPRDCWNREGATWLEQRLFHDREAELQERVDRRRVRLAYASAGGRSVVAGELDAFQHHVADLERAAREEAIDLESECDAPEGEVQVEVQT